MRALILASSLAALAAGCMKTSEKYCGLHPDDTVNCTPVDATGGNKCKTSDDCAAPTPACDLGTGTCVVCVSNTDCPIATAPVCSTAHTCGGCTVHEDCASLACMPDGSCAAESDVAYVEAPAGMGGGVCVRTMPCGKVSQGVASLKKVIKLTGVNDEAVTVKDRATGLTILGGVNAQMLASSGSVLDVQTTTNLVVADVAIGATTVPTGTTGVSLSGAATVSVELRGVRVQNHNNGGIQVSNGTLRMFDSTLYGNQGGGLSIGPLAVGYVIRNNFIVNNGKASGASPPPSVFGGALLSPDVAGTFEFNTVALNSSNATYAPGVNCSGATNHAANNIVVGNLDTLHGANDAFQVNTVAPCAFGNTVKLGSGTSLMFAGAQLDPPDFHLTAASPASVRDAAGDCAATVPTDFDGQARPYGGACDVGADEYRPTN